MRNRILSKEDAALILDFLYLERHKHCKAFRCQRSKNINPARADWQHCIQSIKLLIFQHSQLTHMLSGNRLYGFCICVQLLLGICRKHHCQHCEHHALITSGQVVKEFLALLALKLHIIRNNSREVVVRILATLPVRNVGFNTQQTTFYLMYRFIGRNGQNINGKHHIAVQVSQFRNHAVLNVAGIVFEKQHPAILIAQNQIILVFFNYIRADKVPNIMPLSRHALNVEVKRRFLTGTVKIMQHTQAFCCRQFHTLGTERCKMCRQVSANAGEIRSRLIHIFSCYRNRQVLLLHDTVCARSLIQQHLVIFLAVLVQSVLLHRHQNGFFKAGAALTMVINRQFGSRAAVQTVQQFRIGQEHTLLILAGGHQIVNIRKPIHLGELVAHLKNTIRPDAPDRDSILHLARNLIAFLVLLHDGTNTLNHGSSFPLSLSSPAQALTLHNRYYSAEIE